MMSPMPGVGKSFPVVFSNTYNPPNGSNCTPRIVLNPVAYTVIFPPRVIL
jgi:hypothetical protein